MNIFKKALLVVLGAGLVVVPSTVDKVEEVNAATATATATNTIRVYYNYSMSGWNNCSSPAIYYWGTNVSSPSWPGAAAISTSTSSSFATLNASHKTTYAHYYDLTTDGTVTGLIATFKQNSNVVFKTNDITNMKKGYVYGIKATGYLKDYSSTEKGFTFTQTTLGYLVTLNANGGTINGVETTVVDSKTGESISTVPTYGNNIFKGWKVEGSDDSTASLTVTPSAPTTYVAVWEAPATACEATFVVGDHSFKVIADKGTDISTIVPTAKLEENNLKVISWDKTGTLEGDTTINADKYYTELEKVSAQLYLDYTYKTTNVYLEYYPEDASKPDAVVTAKDSTTGSEKQFTMTEIKKPENGSKGLYLADVPVNYDLIKFTFTSNESDESKRNVVTEFLTRDFANNASWYNWSGDNNFFSYGSPYAQDIVAVENVKLRFTTTNLAASSFAGVETYGIRIALGETIADDDYYGPKWAAADVPTQDGNIIWSAAIENVTNYDAQFTAVPYVVIDGTSYDLCEARTLSVVDAANEYLSNVATLELDSKAQSALNYIIANA